MKRENIKLAKHRKEKKSKLEYITFGVSHISQSKATNNSKKKVQGIKDETNC